MKYSIYSSYGFAIQLFLSFPILWKKVEKWRMSSPSLAMANRGGKASAVHTKVEMKDFSCFRNDLQKTFELAQIRHQQGPKQKTPNLANDC